MMNQGWIGNYSFFRARINPESEAVYDLNTGIRYSYRDLDARADRLANYLKDNFHVKKGDRVAFLSRNRVEMIDAYYATGKCGAILVPYNARLSKSELAQLIRKEAPKALFYEDVFASLAEGVRAETEIGHYVILRGDGAPGQIAGPDDLSYEEIMANGSPEPVCCPELDLEDIHLIIHTGGTTGLPKGGMISHRSMLFNSMNEICTWGISHSDSAHILLPLFHTGGWNLLTLPILHAGGRILVNRQFDPKLSLDVIAREKPTFVFGAATIFRMMVDLPEFETTDFSSVKWVMAGAAPTPLNIMEKFWNKGIRFVLGYGMTEAGPNNISAPAEFMDDAKIREKYASVGKPMYLSLAKIVDDGGNEVGDNVPGELIWSGPQIFSGYWENEEETAKTLIDGWVYSGDMAVRDEEGYYYIVGRKKNMFISGGENVFPPEIETVLYEIPGIHEVCVIGVPDEKWGEAGKAVISLKPGAGMTKEEILGYLKGKLAHYKIPKYIQFVSEIPKNNVGKIVASKVAELYGKEEEV